LPQAILSLSFEVEELDREYVVLPQNEAPQRFCVLAEGLAARFGRTPEGSRQITAIYVPGDMPGLSGLMLPSAVFSVCTLTRCKVLWVSARDLRQTLKHPQIM
jgi:CRP-like cAMP-binding protein